MLPSHNFALQCLAVSLSPFTVGYNHRPYKGRIVPSFTSLRLSQAFPILRSSAYPDVAVVPKIGIADYSSLHNSHVVGAGGQLPPVGAALTPSLRDVSVTDRSGSLAITLLNNFTGSGHRVSSQTIASLGSQGHWAFSSTSLFRVVVCGSQPPAIYAPYLKCIGHAHNCPWEEPSVHVTTAISEPFSPLNVTPCEIQSSVKTFESRQKTRQTLHDKRSTMIFINLGAREATIPSMRDPSISDARALPKGFVQALIWCGQRLIRMWIQVDSTPWATSENRWPSCIEQLTWQPQLAWFTNIGELRFVDPQVWKGLNISSNLLKPTGAIDCVVVQGSGNAVRSHELVDFSQCQLDHDRPWSSDEEFTLITLREQEKSFAEIAERLCRSEFQVVCRYLDIVPSPKPDGFAHPPHREPVMKEQISVYVLWVGYDVSSTDGSPSGWRVYGCLEVHCESENEF